MLSLAQFYELLPFSEYYSLSYQIPGNPSQKLIEIIPMIVEPAGDPPKPDTGVTEPISKPVPGERSQVSNWHFVTLKPRKRDLFTTLLKLQMDNSTPEKIGIFTFKECTLDYPDQLLVRVQNFKLAHQTLQGIEGFSVMQRKPLTEPEVNRMEA